MHRLRKKENVSVGFFFRAPPMARKTEPSDFIASASSPSDVGRGPFLLQRGEKGDKNLLKLAGRGLPPPRPPPLHAVEERKERRVETSVVCPKTFFLRRMKEEEFFERGGRPFFFLLPTGGGEGEGAFPITGSSPLLPPSPFFNPRRTPGEEEGGRCVCA